MTYLAFFQGDERSGRPYETWSGTLGLGSRVANVRRLDGPHGRSPAAPHMFLPRPGVGTLATPLSR
jgi:hypothetical protein